jgi:hypothetical protein
MRLKLVKAFRSDDNASHFVVRSDDGPNTRYQHRLYKATPTGIEEIPTDTVTEYPALFGSKWDGIFKTGVGNISTCDKEDLDHNRFEIILSSDGVIDQIVEKSA